MSESNGNGLSRSPNPPPPTAKLESLRIRQSIAKTLAQSVDLKDLAFETALTMRESFDSEEAADRARAQSQAITSLSKAWAEAVTIGRIVRGIPSPGVIKRGIEQPKSKKSRPANKPPSFKPHIAPDPTRPEVPSNSPAQPPVPQDQSLDGQARPEASASGRSI